MKPSTASITAAPDQVDRRQRPRKKIRRGAKNDGPFNENMNENSRRTHGKFVDVWTVGGETQSKDSGTLVDYDENLIKLKTSSGRIALHSAISDSPYQTSLMKLLIKNGRVIDPSKIWTQFADILIEDGKIAQIGANISADRRRNFRCDRFNRRARI